jgi:hypothetical protein
MGLFRKETNLEKGLILLYFLMGLIELATEFFADSYIQYVIKALITLSLLVLYWHSSTRRNSLFFINMVLLLIGRLYFISKEADMLFYALVAVFFYRITEIYYITKLIKIKDYIPSVLASRPFLFFFLYLVSIPDIILISSYVVLIVQIVLISVLSGIILSHYLSNFNRKDIWLLVFGLMSLMQTFLIFIEKFYLSGFTVIRIRPINLLLNTIVCFSFYKFVIATERLNEDRFSNS